MMRFFETSIKQVVSRTRIAHSALLGVLVAMITTPSTAQVGNQGVFTEMGALAKSAEEGISGSVIGVIGAVALLVLGGAYFLGQTQFAKQYQKQIMVGGVVIALGSSILSYFGLSS